MSCIFFPWQVPCYAPHKANQHLSMPLIGMLDDLIVIEVAESIISSALFESQSCRVSKMYVLSLSLWPHRGVPDC